MISAIIEDGKIEEFSTKDICIQKALYSYPGLSDDKKHLLQTYYATEKTIDLSKFGI